MTDFRRDRDDCRTRGTENSPAGRTRMPVKEKRRRRRACRAILVQELMLHKSGGRAGVKEGGSSDLFVVPRDNLLALIGPTLDRWTKDATGGVDHIGIGGHLYLASEIGTHVDVIRNLFRYSHHPWVSFGLADEIVTALNMPMAFHDGRVPVYVNPRISYKTWCKRAKEQDVDCPAELWLLHSHPEAWTRERLIAKLTKPSKSDPWEEIRV